MNDYFNESVLPLNSAATVPMKIDNAWELFARAYKWLEVTTLELKPSFISKFDISPFNFAASPL
jgi:hypothetical protein